jgi:four helix bundle protein
MRDEGKKMRDKGDTNQRSARPHEALEVYQIAHALALRVHALTLKLPKHELYEEGSQARRSSKSVSAQIVEGHALRQYKPEYLHYLARAYGSAEETIEHLKFLLESGSGGLVAVDCRSLIQEYAVLCRKLYNYMESVRKEHDPNRAMQDKSKRMSD